MALETRQITSIRRPGSLETSRERHGPVAGHVSGTYSLMPAYQDFGFAHTGDSRLRGGASHEAEGRRGARDSGAGRVRAPAGRLRLLRQILNELVPAKFRNPVGVITKSALVTRDLDLLAALATHRCVSITLSVTTLEEDMRRAIEPRASTAAQRRCCQGESYGPARRRRGLLEPSMIRAWSGRFGRVTWLNGPVLHGPVPGAGATPPAGGVLRPRHRADLILVTADMLNLTALHPLQQWFKNRRQRRDPAARGDHLDCLTHHISLFLDSKTFKRFTDDAIVFGLRQPRMDPGIT